MKIKNTIAFCVSTLMLFSGCSRYDDSLLWNDIDKSYNQLTEIKAQLEALTGQIDMLSAVVNGGAITNISKNEDGGYTLRYKGSDNEEKTVVIAGKEDVNTFPILGTKMDGDILYWTITINGKTDYLKDVDGAKIPVAGRTPSFTVDAEGYWCLNGNPLKDSVGNKIKSEGKQVSVVSKVEKDDAGNAVLTLADGSVVTVPLFESFNVSVYYGETEVLNQLDLEGADPVELGYVIAGPAAEQTIVKAMRQENLTATVNAADKKIALTFPEGFEEGKFAVMVADADGNVLIRPIYVVNKAAVPDYYGIKTADDMAKFALAVNTGGNLKRFMNEEGNVILLSDVDMAGVESWIPVGTSEAPFEGVFDGQGFAIKNVAFKTDVTSQLNVGIFGVLGEAVVKNLTVGTEGDTWTVTGKTAAGTSIAGVAAVAQKGSQVLNCKNNVSFDFKAENAKDILTSISGIVAHATGLTISGCINNADVFVKDLANTGNGGRGFQLAGIVGYASVGTTVKTCTNNGDLSAPAGRQGGIVGTLSDATIVECINNGTIEDDKFGQYSANASAYGYKRMGGLVGGTGGTTSIEDCENNGMVITYLGARTGGFAGHNTGKISGCTNKGVILGLEAHNDHGAAWACGFTTSKDNIVDCHGHGRVGDLSYKDTPQSAPYATHYNAVKFQNLKRYDPEANFVDWSSDFYFEMTETANKQLAQGLKFTSYQWNNVPRKMNVLEIDLTNTALELTTAMADDIVPNPNGNGNANNGFKLRETLSQLCARKRAEGEDVLAGINTGFFDSNDGFPRGLHIEEGEPVFVNNQAVRNSLTNHGWAFTVFADRTASCEKKEFEGKYEIAGKEYEYYSVNDTIVRRGHKMYPSNVYTLRYKEVPYSSDPSITNPLLKSALYVVAKYKAGVMTVNNGYAEATVTAINDGRSTPLDKAPYLTADDEVAIQITGDVASEIAAAVKVGDVIKIKADVTVGGQKKPIYTQNSTMYQFVKDGKDASNSVAATNTNHTKCDPVTLVGVDQAGTKVWLIQVDGRQIDLSGGVWTSMGLRAYEMAQISLRLGAYDMTRFDGGGSSAMWVYSDGAGGLVNTPSDSKGERSCMNYIYLRAKK